MPSQKVPQLNFDALSLRACVQLNEEIIVPQPGSRMFTMKRIMWRGERRTKT